MNITEAFLQQHNKLKNMENQESHLYPEKKEFLLECIREVDCFEVGKQYKAIESLFGSPPSSWKQHLPVDKRDCNEFYDCFTVFHEELKTSRGFTNSVIKNFFKFLN